MPPISPRWPIGSTRWMAGASPASPPFLPCCSITTTRKVKPTHNLATLTKAADALAKAGRTGIEVNAPGTTSSVMLQALAEAGATQCEPGNGLHGTTALHVMEDLPERPAMLYLTEVSHLSGGKAYCFGGGFYIDPIFPRL